MSFAPGSDLSIALNGLTVDTQYQQLNVVGLVNLSNVDLRLSHGFTPSVGNSFVIVNNDGTDAIAGTFNGLAEAGFRFTSDDSDLSNYLQRGRRQDVVLTAVNPTNPTLAGTAGDDNWLVKRNAANLDITLNNMLIWTTPFDGLASLAINGLVGNDTLTADLAGGDAIPAGKLDVQRRQSH